MFELLIFSAIAYFVYQYEMGGAAAPAATRSTSAAVQSSGYSSTPLVGVSKPSYMPTGNVYIPPVVQQYNPSAPPDSRAAASIALQSQQTSDPFAFYANIKRDPATLGIKDAPWNPATDAQYQSVLKNASNPSVLPVWDPAAFDFFQRCTYITGETIPGCK